MQKYWGILLALTVIASCKDADNQKNDVAQNVKVVEVPKVTKASALTQSNPGG